ncbi:hypothetical protein WJX79_006627 [Trebouxia sp. C0005]
MGARVMEGVVSGLLRTAATELTRVRVSLIEADHHTASSGLFNQTNASDASQCLGFLNSATVAAGTLSKPQLTYSKVRAPGQDLFQLRPEPRGSLSNLVPMPFDASSVKLKPNQVLVQIRALGLNFRDVLNVLGMYPGNPGLPGADCAGVIMAVGPAVATSKVVDSPSFTVGDAVFGIAPGSLGSCVATSVSSLVHMPTHLGFHEAATVPTVMVTGQVALKQAAQVSAGDTILVHAAAGGVGLAAIQLLHALGATVIATAGSAQKRAVLHQLGVRHVLSSRLTQFAAEVAQLGGVDVVLNSLTSAGMVAASLAVLKPGGRFIEISKRDIWAQQLAALARPDCSFFYIAVDFLSPVCIQSSLQWVSAALTKGTLCPLPSICHPLGNAPAAFRQMMQASHVGKVVLTHPATGLTRAGVFVGISWTEYAKMASTHGVPVGAYTAQSAVLSVAAGRISYHFGYKGPAVAMDTACSSSLVAANAARECALSHGHALTGGINMTLLPSTTDMFQRAGMLTRDGRCKVLDAAADGYVRSESCAMVMMASSWGRSHQGSSDGSWNRSSCNAQPASAWHWHLTG